MPEETKTNGHASNDTPVERPAAEMSPQALLAASERAITEACWKELEQVLKKLGCMLDPYVTLYGGGRTMSGCSIVVKRS